MRFNNLGKISILILKKETHERFTYSNIIRITRVIIYFTNDRATNKCVRTVIFFVHITKPTKTSKALQCASLKMKTAFMFECEKRTFCFMKFIAIIIAGPKRNMMDIRSAAQALEIA